jgi:hypothetical protein
MCPHDCPTWDDYEGRVVRVTAKDGHVSEGAWQGNDDYQEVWLRADNGGYVDVVRYDEIESVEVLTPT